MEVDRILFTAFPVVVAAAVVTVLDAAADVVVATVVVAAIFIAVSDNCVDVVVAKVAVVTTVIAVVVAVGYSDVAATSVIDASSVLRLCETSCCGGEVVAFLSSPAAIH